jgi:uncharacterized hydrophobic protein (TIGR00271 family)
MASTFIPNFLNRESIRKSRRNPVDVRAAQEANATFDLTFISILVFASSIATLGLASNSEATIVGAMLISPLMRPIMALAYAVAVGDGRMKRKSLLTLSGGILITLLTSAVVENLLSLYEPTNMILARIQPSLVDLSVAVAAAAAGTLAATRSNVSDALPGVAIAVSLVPPLCVTGIGISVGSSAIALGSLTLFTVNLVGIVLAAATIFVLEGIGGFFRSIGSLAIILISIVSLGYFLGDTQTKMLQEDRAHDVIEDYLKESYVRDRIAHPGDLNRVMVMDYPDHVFVFAEIKSMPEKFTEAEMTELHKRLTSSFNQDVNLKVLIVHANETTFYTRPLPTEVGVDYGLDVLVPKN